jgi:hypothetical protein
MASLEIENEEELKETEDYALNVLQKTYRVCLFKEGYKDVCDSLEVDKAKLYSHQQFKSLFRKILIVLAKHKKFEDFDVVADNIIKYDLQEFFWNVFYEIIESNYCKKIFKIS